ncbi:multicopper oxidase domain-containing protein [Occallatibacter savannae]|uniref:multicopper oxidase domain-containing protein n=1 Tax=Occallatibacter savannae TaxID=1002691 RepID=UPI000D68A844|nr:multicopper oxidase domain-containing protein [Occallatibacter savannae]
MSRRIVCAIVWVFVAGTAVAASAQSFRVQCPPSTITHPNAANNNAEPAYTGATNGSTYVYTPGGASAGPVNGAIKCQQISGGDGYATMGDGTQTYLFAFGPLSGLADVANGLPGTQFPAIFNTLPAGPLLPGDPATTDNASTTTTSSGTFGFNGAVGLIPNLDSMGDGNCTGAACIDGHVDPRQIMDVGVMNGNVPAPLMAIDEDDEYFLTLSNVGMIMRPDLFEQHTVHFHGYPNASSFYDGVPDASVAINIGGSFTYYYLAPDAGTYFYHCHITPPEHLQMGMVGQLYVRPRQNRVPSGTSVFMALQAQQSDPRTACNPNTDILCTNPLPYSIVHGTDNSPDGGFQAVDPATKKPLADPETKKYAYNDGDGSTQYDVEYPLQIHGFDPNFHFVGMTFNPEGFADMKDKYFLLNGRSYPDTVTSGPLTTQSADGVNHFSQPLPAIINIPAGKKALLRISDLDVSEYQTLASLGIPMTVIGINAKLLRDQSGNNMYYKTNSITLGGGESLDVILDASDTTRYSSGQVFYLYTPNLDHLANDAENFGGLMTEVHIL